MIIKHYGKTISLDVIREKTKLSKFGVTLFGIKEVAKEFGFDVAGLLVDFEQLKNLQLPLIVHWRQKHFVVIYKITPRRVYVSDPARGNKVYKIDEFLKLWTSTDQDGQPVGAVLTLSPLPEFYELEETKEFDNVVGMWQLVNYLKQHRRDVLLIMIAIGVSSLLQFLFPFLTQSIVDTGIATKNVNFVLIVLFAQLSLLAGRFFIEYVRGWLLLYVSSRINVTILSDFLIKLLKLPLSFFDTKRTGDILQRINDQRRIQDFLTGPFLEMIFSIVSMIVLSLTLFFYNTVIFLIFIVATLIYFGWSVYMLKARRAIDYKRFELSADNQNSVIQIVNGIQDIKLNNSERHSRWEWEKIQAELFDLNIKSLKISQIQQSGSFFINEGKNAVITFIAALGVINGQFTLGVMLAIQAIVGQLNGPISLLISLFQNFYETRLSIERLNEIHQVKDEFDDAMEFAEHLVNVKDINVNHLTFAYPGSYQNVLNDLNFTIPFGKTTAIVGSSGSGKTTLLKILLKFYENYDGELTNGDVNFRSINPREWRDKCGTVLQDGFIFSDSIANNVAIGEEEVDRERILQALVVANIWDFINSLPLKENTKIGADGMGISQGQKQRILIARAVYKNPDYIFFDEATNALDANNESIITRNLQSFFKDKTRIIVAHRLSTVKNADQILVMDQGRLIETGNHLTLVRQQGAYHTLVRNQLELEDG